MIQVFSLEPELGGDASQHGKTRQWKEPAVDQLPPPKSRDQPWPSPDAMFVDLGRGGLGCSLTALVLLLFFTTCATAGALWPEQILTNGGAGGERTIATVIAVVFGVLSVAMVLMLIPTLKTHGLAVDRSGLWFVTKKTAEVVSWEQVRALGGSYKVKQRTYKRGVGAKLGQELARSALTDQGRILHSIEVFLHDPHAVAGRRPFDQHLRLTQDEAPPTPGLPHSRLRFVCRHTDHYRKLAAHLSQGMPHLWVGEYQRRGAF